MQKKLLIGALTIAAMLPGGALAQTANQNPNAEVEAAVRSEFTDAPAMVEVARCESGFRQFRADGSVLMGGAGGGMIGVFQINRIHLPQARALGMDVMTLQGNVAYARYLYESSGSTPWLSSAYCWRLAPVKAAANVPVVSISSSTSASVSAVLPTIRTGLRLGNTGSSVLALQQVLNSAGFAVAMTGPGSPGNETTKFGAATRMAVRKFQCARSIACSGSESTTGYGLVGPRTSAALSQVLLSMR